MISSALGWLDDSALLRSDTKKRQWAHLKLLHILLDTRCYGVAARGFGLEFCEGHPEKLVLRAMLSSPEDFSYAPVAYFTPQRATADRPMSYCLFTGIPLSHLAWRIAISSMICLFCVAISLSTVDSLACELTSVSSWRPRCPSQCQRPRGLWRCLHRLGCY